MSEIKKINVFFLANIPVKGVDASYGGATVLAQEMLDYIKSDLRLNVGNQPIRRIWRPKWHMVDHILWVVRFPWAVRKYDVVSIHATWDFTFTSAPLIWLWARLLNKRIVYHFFGGNFHQQYEALPGLLKTIYRRTILSSDVVLFETKELIQYFSERNIADGIWLPNARKAIHTHLETRPFSKRFVFISRIIPDKGIHEILQLAEKLPEDYTVDLYGPVDERYTDTALLTSRNISYKGVLKPEEVTGVLDNYDVLLLPTWFKYEGYPGIVLEALSLGKPVISTLWNSIPEIIRDGYNGLLIPVKNVEALNRAILHFNEDNYKIFQENAFNSFESFDSDKVFRKLVNSYF